MIAGVLLLLASAAEAPPAEYAVCPEFQVSSSAGDGTITFTLPASGASDDVTFNWMVSSGTIVSGQGTAVIEVSADPGQFVTASVDIGGVSRDCPTFISASDEIYAPYEGDAYEPDF